MKPTPIVALNRAVAAGKAFGPEVGLTELKDLPNSAKLIGYPFYPAAQGEFNLLAGRSAEAAKHFERARQLAQSLP